MNKTVAVLAVAGTFVLIFLSFGYLFYAGLTETLERPAPSQAANQAPSQTNQPSPHSTASQKRHIEIQYSFTIMDEVECSIGDYDYEVRAGRGKHFVVVSMTITNNGYDKFNTSPYSFKLIQDNIKYNIHLNGLSIAGHEWESVDVMDGGTFRGALMFETPSEWETYSLSNEAYTSSLRHFDIVWKEV